MSDNPKRIAVQNRPFAQRHLDGNSVWLSAGGIQMVKTACAAGCGDVMINTCADRFSPWLRERTQESPPHHGYKSSRAGALLRYVLHSHQIAINLTMPEPSATPATPEFPATPDAILEVVAD